MLLLRYSLASRIISLAPKIDDNILPFASVLDSHFYNIKTSEILTFPTIRELTNFVMKKETIEFKISNKTFVICPMEEAYFIKKGKKTNIGKFQRISPTKSGVKIVFTDGDECIPGVRYQCVVNISAGSKDSYKQEFCASSYQIQLNIQLRDALASVQKNTISITSSKPSLGTKLISLIKNGKKQGRCDDSFVNIRKAIPKRTNFLIKNRILESAHTINAENLKKMAMKYSRELTDENDTMRNGSSFKKASTNSDIGHKPNQGHVYNTMISTKKKIAEENASKNISDISKVFENIGSDQPQKKKKKKSGQEIPESL